jgi:EmrB/QacA subfamily drug resistance transporter
MSGLDRASPFNGQVTEERRRTLTLIICCVAQFMVVLDVSIVNVALPSISADLRFDPASLAWVVNAYTLAFAGFLLLGGRAADLLGRREVFAGGLALFALASLAGGLAQSELTLVLARAAQGLGGAVVAPATLSILTTGFPEGSERNRALGLWGAMGAIGGASGALLGGLLTEALSWRWILFVNVPIGLLGALVALRVVQAGRRDAGATRQFDLAGALTVTVGLVVLTYGIVQTDEHGWGSARTLLTLAAGAALLAVFVVVEGRLAARPLVPLRIFGSRALSAANAVVFCLGGSVFAMWYFVSLYLQQVLGYSPLEAGVAFLPMPITIAACTQAATRLTGRYGAGPVLAFGMAMIAAGMLLFARVPPDGGYVPDVLGPALLCSAGIGFSFVPVTIAATAGVDRTEAGLASGLVNTSRQMGGSLGLALLATVATQRTAGLAGDVSRVEALTEGFQRAFAVGAAIALTGALVSAFVLTVRAPRSA